MSARIVAANSVQLVRPDAYRRRRSDPARQVRVPEGDRGALCCRSAVRPRALHRVCGIVQYANGGLSVRGLCTHSTSACDACVVKIKPPRGMLHLPAVVPVHACCASLAALGADGAFASAPRRIYGPLRIACARHYLTGLPRALRKPAVLIYAPAVVHWAWRRFRVGLRACISLKVTGTR